MSGAAREIPVSHGISGAVSVQEACRKIIRLWPLGCPGLGTSREGSQLPVQHCVCGARINSRNDNPSC